MEFIVRSMEELERAARAVLDDLRASDAGATIVTLSGELGAGKTAFVQAVARLLGITETVTSPTFVIEKEYETPDDVPFKRLTHIDAYRLSGERELATIGWKDVASRPRSLVMLEWPERIPEVLASAYARMTFTGHESPRTITYVRA